MFDRDADLRAIPASAIGLVARAEAICRKQSTCPKGGDRAGSPCPTCCVQAEVEVKRENALRNTSRRLGRLQSGDRIA